MKPTVTLIQELRKMSDKRDRNNYDIGDYWNAVEEAADAMERVLTERDEAIREVEKQSSLAEYWKAEAQRQKEAQPYGVALEVGEKIGLEMQLEAEKRRTAAYLEVVSKFFPNFTGVLEVEAQKLLADSGGEKGS